MMLKVKIHTFFKCIYLRAYNIVGITIHLLFVKSLNNFPLPHRVWPFSGQWLLTSGLEAL